MSGNSGSRSMITFRDGGGNNSPGTVITLLTGALGAVGGTSHSTNGFISLGISGICRITTVK